MRHQPFVEATGGPTSARARAGRTTRLYLVIPDCYPKITDLWLGALFIHKNIGQLDVPA